MSDQNVHKAGFTSSGIARGSPASSIMSGEAKSFGGGVPSGGTTATLQEMGMRNFVFSFAVFVLFCLVNRANQNYILENKLVT